METPPVIGEGGVNLQKRDWKRLGGFGLVELLSKCFLPIAIGGLALYGLSWIESMWARSFLVEDLITIITWILFLRCPFTE